MVNTLVVPEAPGAPVEQRLRRVLPDQRPVPRVRGPAPEGEHTLPGRGRHEVLRAQGDQGRGGLSQVHRQPDGPGLAHAHHQHAVARHRRGRDRQDPRGGRERARNGLGRDHGTGWSAASRRRVWPSSGTLSSGAERTRRGCPPRSSRRSWTTC